MSNVEFQEDLLRDLHDCVQVKLASLDDFIRQRVPDVVIGIARTTGKQFLLFTYRTYSSPSHDAIDPVVVGLTFTRTDAGVSIEADASGEETGDLIVPLPCQHSSPRRADLIDSATGLAAQLVTAKERIAAAVLYSSRRRIDD